jgi:hypothetical protein
MKIIIYIITILFIFSISAVAGDKPVFSADKAWNYLLAQCRFGARNPGSSGHLQGRDFLHRELLKFTPKVQLQSFSHYDKRLNEELKMWNIIADFGDETTAKILLCAHWDTRPRSDKDPNPLERNKPLIGANDGASGVAVLLEMARLFSISPPPIPVQIVFFDGEDYGYEGETWDYLLGSKYFAKNITKKEYSCGVLLDLIGDKDLEIKREFNSFSYSRSLQDKIWGIARKLGEQRFSERLTAPIIDDHLSLIEVGIPAINIIDFEYSAWHTQADTPENCSKASLEAVGRVLAEWIYQEKGN